MHIYDASGGIISTIEHDTLTDETTLGNFQSAESTTAVLESVKRANSYGAGWNKDRDMKWLGRVPVGLAESIAWQEGISPGKFWAWHPRKRNDFLRKRIFNNRDYRDLRIGS